MRIAIISPILAAALLAGCSSADLPSTYAPTVTVDPTTGTATETPSTATPSGDLFQQFASDIGVQFGADDVAFVNLSGGVPVADPVGYACASDLANLSNGLKATPNGDPLSQPGPLSSVEALRLQFMLLQSAGGNPLLQQTLQDCDNWAMSTVQMGIALKPEVLAFLNQLQVTMIQSGGTSVIPTLGVRRLSRPVVLAPKPFRIAPDPESVIIAPTPAPVAPAK
jgi:hypothetical protein